MILALCFCGSYAWDLARPGLRSKNENLIFWAGTAVRNCGLLLLRVENLLARLGLWLIPVIEFLLLTVALLVLLLRRRRNGQSRTTSLRWLERTFGRLARHRGLTVSAVGAAVVALRVGLIPVLGVPEPRWDDGFSYLLAADTFAHGKMEGLKGTAAPIIQTHEEKKGS